MLTFDYLRRCKQAVSACDFNCKLILDHGVYALFPDGYKVNMSRLEFMRTPTLTKWLNVLYLIRKDRVAYGNTLY